MSTHRLTTSAVGANQVQVTLRPGQQPGACAYELHSIPAEAGNRWGPVDGAPASSDPQPLRVVIHQLARLGIVLPEDVVRAVEEDTGHSGRTERVVDYGEIKIHNSPVPVEALAAAAASGAPIRVRICIALEELWEMAGDVELLNDRATEIVCAPGDDEPHPYSLSDISFTTVTYTPDPYDGGWFGGDVWLLVDACVDVMGQ